MAATITSILPAVTALAGLEARSFTGVHIDIPSITPPHITPPSITVPTGPFYTEPVRTDCVTATPDANGHVPPDACNAFWDFSPSFGAAIFFCLVFGGLIVAHMAQAIVFKKKFAWVIIMGCSWEFASFITRAFGARHQQNSGASLVTQILVLLAPLWINAFVYMVFGRMIHFLVPSRSLFGVRANLITRLFVLLDIGTFIIQLIGGFMASGHDVPQDQLRRGLDIYMGGIGIQEFWIMVFAAMAIKFWMEVRKAEAQGLLITAQARRWRWLAIALYAVLVFISTRIFFRLAEFSGGTGFSNPIPLHEWFFYVFDATPMVLAALSLSVIHPGLVLKGPGSEFPSLSRGEKKEVKKIVRQAQNEAKIRGVNWLGRLKIARHVKRGEVYRRAAERDQLPLVNKGVVELEPSTASF